MPLMSIYKECSFLVAELLYNSLCLSRYGWNAIFLAAFKVRQLIFLVKISKTDAHLIYTLLGPSVCWACFTRCKHYFLKVSWVSWSFFLSHFSFLWELNICAVTLSDYQFHVFCVLSYFGCCHTCFILSYIKVSYI